MERIQRHRFVCANDLYRLFPHRSPDKLSRRLTRLYRSGLLDRPQAQIDYYRGEGSKPLVYGLDAAGARLLATNQNLTTRVDGIRARNKRFNRENLDHTLAVASFLIDAELACMRHPDLRYIDGRNVQLGGESTGWPVTVPWRGYEASIQVAPDAVFGLARKDGERELKSFYFLELDRGTMTIVPSKEVRERQAFLYRSSILRKLFAYAIGHKERAHRQRYDLHVARVLLVTTSTARAAQMRKAAAQLVVKQAGVSPELFLFGSVGDAGKFTDITGNSIHLIDG